MLLRIGERLVAIDTGSSNGTWQVAPGHDWQAVRVAQLEDGTRLALGSERALAEWQTIR